MEIHYYLFDMDGTLFFTDELNNESYNFVLIKNKFQPIHNVNRITREVVREFYPEIDEQEIAKIIEQKQNYFIKNVKKVKKNNFLFDLLQKNKKDKCILWTSADRKRAEIIIKEFELRRFFNEIIFSNKKNISEDIDRICSKFSCTNNQLLAFEDNIFIAKKFQENQINCFLLIRP